MYTIIVVIVVVFAVIDLYKKKYIKESECSLAFANVRL